MSEIKVKQKDFNLIYLLALAFTSAMGGFLFGYDWVVIGGAKPFYELYFGLKNSPLLQGWAMSSALIGCILGALLAGLFSDKFGRKYPLIGAAFLFIISAFGSGYTDDFSWFVFYRILGGVGIGIASTLSPLYIAELAPGHLRGRFVSINQLTIVFGILAAQISNYLIAEPVLDSLDIGQMKSSWNSLMGWRWMFWAELVPATLFFILMFTVPKSPRFLIKINRDTEAFRILKKIGGFQYAENELISIKRSLENNLTKVHRKELFHPKVKPILLIGIVLAVFQQWCGINVIFNYAEEIFTAAGYSVGDMLFNIIITGSVNLLFTLIAMRFVDSWGRKRLMLFGALGLTWIYLVMGLSYYMGWTGLPILLLVIAAIAVYAMTLAPVTWVILSEIFPNRIRGMAMSLATLTLWIASFALTYSFPILNSRLNASGTFWVYGLICLAGYFFILKRLPETKGKSLEEIESEFLK
ncbi:MAG: MFS transporter [Mongoliibacter sp.]|uniref:sugar porter family MFS transporter n=1 Tax=Mongoliibacter sp. TaxID=2022438 RepID=UPI0012F02C23|nr:sugar porter family MFS transporter [Mongoliibacter sp.]TVP53346.1 MAG: MFS transporter [Mongoliibacter sp.]